MQLLAVAVKPREDEGHVQFESTATLLLTGHAGKPGIVSCLEVRTITEVTHCAHLQACTSGLFAVLSTCLCAVPCSIKLAMAEFCFLSVHNAAGYLHRGQQQCVQSCDLPAG